MHSLFSKRGVVLAGLLAAALGAFAPSVAEAKPEPTAKPRGFRLFARSLGAMTINRVYCGLAATGEVCVDSTNSSTIGGGYWPKGTADQYVFNSGLQVAGRISGGPWNGNTTGAFFFDPKGTTQHGEEVVPIYNTTNPEDAEFLGAANGDCDEVCQAGKIPSLETDSLAQLFDPLLRGRAAASQGDVWWLSWDGNPSLNAGRPHPLGVLVEQRGMGWNYPAGNEDIIYFIYTFYNVTASDPAAYANVRPGMRELLIQKGQEFQARNEEAFGVDIPDAGYTITEMHAAFAADNDVADAGANYSSVNLPFALGYTYEHTFGQPAGWSFDAGIFADPFFSGVGFIGIKYLKSPTGPGAIQLYSNTLNGGVFDDADNVTQLYRYLSGRIDPSAGDGNCNLIAQDPRVCYIAPEAFDTRFFMSSTALTLAPGEFQSIVVAYIFAAPVKIGSINPPEADVSPLEGGGPLATSRISELETPGRVPRVDSVAGFVRYRGDGFTPGSACPDTLQPNGVPDQCEFEVVPGSLLGKANVAQEVFNNRFLLPFAPEAPNFYVVPGNNQVTVLWQPSSSETTGDPFFAIASDPESPLFDPNYRQFDVEGYRIYRGRVDAPNELTLIAQFDYAGTALKDVRGFIDPTVGCAPEFGVDEDCAANFIGLTPDPDRPDTNEVPLVGAIVQTRPGGRVTLGTGAVVDSVFPLLDTLSGTGTEDDPFVFDTVGFDTTQVFRSNATQLLVADTALVGGGQRGACAPSACPELSDNGVPFVYVDNTVRNNFRYFYSVTAFDVNSFTSGPSSIESPRNTKAVTPVPTASNTAQGELEFGLYGADGTQLDPGADDIAIDPATGMFTGTPAPTNAIAGAFAPFVPALLPAVSLTATIDSVVAFAGDQPECAGIENGLGSCYVFYVNFNKDGAEQDFQIPTPWPVWGGGFDANVTENVTLGAFPIELDPTSAARFGIPTQGTRTANAAATAALYHYIDFSGFEGQGGRRNRFGDNNEAACGASLTNCTNSISVGGSRWFSGAAEATPHPTVGIKVGRLEGIDSVWAPIHHVDATPETPGEGGLTNSTFIQYFGYGFGGLGRHADIEVTWGENGTLASVMDVTHKVPVPFSGRAAASWGFLTDANGDGKLGWFDWEHIPNVCPFFAYNGANVSCDPADPSTLVELTQTATIQPVSLSGAGAQPVAGNGFALYIAGERYHFLTNTLPAAGTKWTLRQYVGRVDAADNVNSQTPSGYRFRPGTSRSAAIANAQVKFQVTGAERVVAVTKADLERVHTVPDPYYVTNEFEQTTDNKILKFVNLPNRAIIRIYSSSGVLVNVIEHNSVQNGGAATWNLRNRNNQVVASGVYFYHVESGDARRVGRFTVVNFAQ